MRRTRENNDKNNIYNNNIQILRIPKIKNNKHNSIKL